MKNDQSKCGVDSTTPHTVGACAAAFLCDLFFGLCAVLALRRYQMEIQMAEGGVNVGIAGILLFGALVVGFDVADLRSLVLRRHPRRDRGFDVFKNCHRHFSFRFFWTSSLSDKFLCRLNIISIIAILETAFVKARFLFNSNIRVSGVRSLSEI